MKRLLFRIWTVLCLICMFSVWPLGVIRTEISVHNGEDGRIGLDLDGETLCAEQYFVPTYSDVRSISFAVSYEETGAAENAVILFSLLDQEGVVLFSSEEPLKDFAQNSFYTVTVDQRLTAGETYCWRVSLGGAASDGAGAALLCTDPGVLTPGENRLLYYAGEASDRVSVAMYTYSIIPGKIHILVYDAFLVCVFLLGVLGLKKINKQ